MVATRHHWCKDRDCTMQKLCTAHPRSLPWGGPVQTEEGDTVCAAAPQTDCSSDSTHHGTHDLPQDNSIQCGQATGEQQTALQGMGRGARCLRSSCDTECSSAGAAIPRDALGGVALSGDMEYSGPHCKVFSAHSKDVPHTDELDTLTTVADCVHEFLGKHRAAPPAGYLDYAIACMECGSQVCKTG